MNINRDYLIINDVKKSNIKLDNGSMFFYITDKNTQNIFVNLVINISNNDLIQKYANIENAEDYTLTMNIVKPDNTYKIVEGKLHDKEKAIFEFNLNEDCCDEIGTYRCELLTKCNINDHKEVTTSNKLTYKVKSSVLNDLDEIQEAPEYPLVIQLFDKLSDIEQYEEDRRANELARQVAEQQRQTRFGALDAAMVDGIQGMDDKVVEVENRITTKEQAVDKLIVDTKADIDEYKVAKDQEIDDYKTAKDTEINNTITAQDTKIDTAISEQNNRILAVENNDAVQDNRLDIVENRLSNIGGNIPSNIQSILDTHTSRLEAIEAIDVSQNNRLDAIESKNQQQDDRLLDIEKVNKKQEQDIRCLYGFHENTIDITEEGNSIYLPNSVEGHCEIDNIQGNTLVNCNKEPNKELILNGNINTSGDNAVTITEGVDGGLVDVALEGNTLVNVSKTKDSTAITKSYTVENSGNHIALQGDVDGNCRPVITGNTLWIDNDTEEVLTAFDETKNLRLQSSFEDDLVTQEMVDSGEEVADNLGKYRVDYKVTGKNKFDKSKALDGYEIANTDIRQNSTWFVTDFIPAIPNTSYKISGKSNGDTVLYYDNNKQFLGKGRGGVSIITPPKNAKYVRLNGMLTQKDTFQIEEGDTATSYEPYKEPYTKTLYLNSPLLEGDTTEEKDNGIYHVHRSELVPYTEGDEASLITDKVNTLRQLETPQYELIEQSNLVIPSYVNGHLDLASAVPVEKAEFKSFSEELTYLCANTQYTVQFISDKATTADITLGGTQLLAQSITQGLNRISITTPETLVDNKLVISGVGANISEVVVTDTDRVFGYFEDMKSVGQDDVNGHKIEILSQNKNLFNESEHLYQCSMGVGQFNWGFSNGGNKRSLKVPCKPNTTYTFSKTGGDRMIICSHDKDFDGESKNVYMKYCYYNSQTSGHIETYTFTTHSDSKVICIYISKDSLATNIQLEESSSKTNYAVHKSNKKEILLNEPLRAVRNVKDRYVLIDGKWYIERKCGIRAYQEGDKDNYKTDLINTVYPLTTATYELIDYNPLEVYSGTTHITTNSTIPTNITVKNHGFNCLLKPSTTYTISSNLGLNTVTTPSTLTEDCLRFMDTDTSDVTTMKNVLVLEGDWTSKADLIPANFSGIESAFEQEYDAEKGKYKVNVRGTNENVTAENNMALYINEPLRGIEDVKDKIYVKDNKVVVERKCGTRAYQDGDFGTYPTDKVNTVYPLAEPIYEEVEYNGVKLSIEIFKNSTLFYNSNVPVTSTVHYSYSVPIVDKVAQTANISDEQDVMIIDLASQVAVMEMLLM